MPVADLVGNRRVLQGLNPRDFADDTFGVPTVTDVLAELDKPGRDPRPEFKTAALAEGINKVSDLTPGMVLEGTVTNVAAFGAFVDVGVHQDGLVHVSAMSDKFVSDPHDVVSSGQVVKVKVMEVDVERQRIGLSLRLNDEPGQGRSGSTGERGNGGREGSGRRGGNRNDGRGGNNGNRGGNRNGKPGGRNSGRDGGTNSGNNSGAAASGSMADALKRAGFGR